jgi:hypothetical protein
MNDLRENLIKLGMQLPDGLNLDLDRWAAKLSEAPCRNTVAVVGLTSLLFYLAERGHNPKVNQIWDASVYCSTCLSVGYSDIFAKTPIGKIVGTALMTIGPALAAKTLDGPEQSRREEVQQKMLDTLRQILAKLEEREPAL